MALAIVFVAGYAAAQQVRYSAQHLQGERALPQTVTGGSKALQAKLKAGRAAISVAVADFDGDGTKDLLTGYATPGGGVLLLQRGSAAALATIGSERGVMPYGSLAQPIDLPVQPDILQAADVSGHGFMDIIAGAKGDATVYLLRGSGKGGFTAPLAVTLSGDLSALTTWTSPAGKTSIVAAVCSATGCGLQVLGGDGKTRAFVPTSGAVTSVQSAVLHGHGVMDLVAVAGGKVLTASGDALLGKFASWGKLPVTGAAAVAAGSFVYDRRGYQQLAVVDEEGALHVFARSGVDNTVPTRAEIKAGRSKRRSGAVSGDAMEALGWAEVEVVHGVAQTGSAPLLQRARVSGSGGDDLLVLSGTQYVTVRHVTKSDGRVVGTKPVVVVDSMRSVALGVSAARLNADSRQGTIVAEGGLSPELGPQPTANTWYVNTQTDGLDDLTTSGRCTNGNALLCTLRDAVGLANQDAATNIANGNADTINIPDGIYGISHKTGTGVDADGDATYHMEVEGPINFVGAGQAGVVIDGGAHDKIFSIDDPFDPNGSFVQAAFDVYFSGLTLQNGENTNNVNVGASNPDGGLIDWDADGSGNLTFSSVTLQDSSTPWGHGGAVAGFSATYGGSGVLEFDSSVLSENQTAEAGGGIFAATGVNLAVNATTLSNNGALATNFGGNDPNAYGTGGAIEFYGQGSASSSITNGSVVEGNSATAQGGGVETQDAMTITNTSFASNSAAATPSYGGGLMLDGGLASISTSLAEDTFTGNSAVTSGGAIQEGLSVGDAGQTLTMQYSRLYGNTSGGDTGLALGVAGGSIAAETADATDNWWGCNGPATGAGCDTAGLGQSSGTLTLTPYTTLTLTLSSTTPALNGTVTATGSLGQDSDGTTYTPSDDAAYAGVAASLTITQGSSTVSSSASALDSSASIQASAAVTASGSATVSVDSASVTESFTVATPTQLVFTAAPATPLTAGGNAGSVQVSLEDGLGDVITGSSASVTLVVTGPGSYSQTYTATASSGVASFNLSAVALTTAGTYTYTATSTGLTQAQATEVVNAAAAASFSVTGYPNPAEIGVGATVTVTALDGYGNVATGFAGTVTLTSSDPNALLPAPHIYTVGDSGVATFNATLYTAGVQSITASSGAITGAETGIMVGDSIWLVNADGTLARLNEDGVPTLSAGSSNGASTLGAVAFDAAGDVWSVANATSSVSEYSFAGAAVGTTPFVTGVNTPPALAIDGAGQVWIANGDNSIDVLNAAGSQVSPSGTYQPPGVSTPTGIVIDSSGSVWITNAGNNSVTKIIGGAAPVVTPTVQQVVLGSQGVRP